MDDLSGDSSGGSLGHLPVAVMVDPLDQWLVVGWGYS